MIQFSAPLTPGWHDPAGDSAGVAVGWLAPAEHAASADTSAAATAVLVAV
jgi:hypothetical protein